MTKIHLEINLRTYLLVKSCGATLFLGAETHALNIFDRLDTHLLFAIKLHAFATLLSAVP